MRYVLFTKRLIISPVHADILNREEVFISGPFAKQDSAEKAMQNSLGGHTVLSAQVLDEITIGKLADEMEAKNDDSFKMQLMFGGSLQTAKDLLHETRYR